MAVVKTAGNMLQKTKPQAPTDWTLKNENNKLQIIIILILIWKADSYFDKNNLKSQSHLNITFKS